MKAKNYQYKLITAFILLLIITVSVLILRPEKEQPKKQKIIYVSKVLDYDSDFWTQLLEGLNAASDAYNIDFQAVAPSKESDYEKQKELVEWAISQDPDAIILTPSQYMDKSKIAQKIVDKGIPLILVDSMLEKNIAQASISTDNVEAGKKQGAYVKKSFDPSARIAVIAHEIHTSTSIERVNGLKQGLADRQDQLVTIAYTSSDYTISQQKTKEVLEEFPDITVLVATNEHTTVGAAAAIKELGLENQISLIGFDSSIKEIQLMEEGLLKATVIQKAFKMGYYALENAVAILNDKPCSFYTDSGSILITQENLYDVNMQKLLFPFKQ